MGSDSIGSTVRYIAASPIESDPIERVESELVELRKALQKNAKS